MWKISFQNSVNRFLPSQGITIFQNRLIEQGIILKNCWLKTPKWVKLNLINWSGANSTFLDSVLEIDNFNITKKYHIKCTITMVLILC